MNSLIIIFNFKSFFIIIVKLLSNFSLFLIISFSFLACSNFISSFFSLISNSLFFLAFSSSNCSIFSFNCSSWANLSCSIFCFSAFSLISFSCVWYSSICFFISSSISFFFLVNSSSKSFLYKLNSSCFLFSFSSFCLFVCSSISLCNSNWAVSQSMSYISSPVLVFIYKHIVFVPKIILSLVFKIWPSWGMFLPLTKIYSLASLSFGFNKISSSFFSNIAWFCFIPIPDKVICGGGFPCFLPTYTGKSTNWYFNLWLNCGSSFNTTKWGNEISTCCPICSPSFFLASSNLSSNVFCISLITFWFASYCSFKSRKAALSSSPNTPPCPINFFCKSSIIFFNPTFSSFNILTILSCSLSLITALFWIFFALSA